jgi:hypothetical protein
MSIELPGKELCSVAGTKGYAVWRDGNCGYALTIVNDRQIKVQYSLADLALSLNNFSAKHIKPALMHRKSVMNQ